MLNLTTVILRKPVIFSGKQSIRWISALYITGDKANENYVTLQPYLDFTGTFRDRHALQASITKRKSAINLETLLSKYAKYQKLKTELQHLEDERETITNKLKSLSKSNTAAAKDIQVLKERGKSLRNDVKTLKQTIYPIEDEFIHDFLHLPNKLHEECPSDSTDKLLYRSQLPNELDVLKTVSHLKCKDLIRFIDNSCYYLMDAAAHFEVQCGQALTRYFVENGDFLQTANPDFVRCVLLEANATPLEHYHMVKEEQLQNKLNSAYLTGGAAFESYLGAMTKLSIYPNVLPLRLVCLGRSYNRADGVQYGPTPSLYTAIQTNTVQTFVATETATDADTQLQHVLNLAVDFYKTLNVPFRVTYIDASLLTPSECLRANIEVYSPVLKRYVCVGYISNYSDFVSKRILFNVRREKNHNFLHLVGGPVLYVTRLIAALLENGISLTNCKLLGNIPANPTKTAHQSAIDEFKSIFK